MRVVLAHPVASLTFRRAPRGDHSHHPAGDLIQRYPNIGLQIVPASIHWLCCFSCWLTAVSGPSSAFAAAPKQFSKKFTEALSIKLKMVPAPARRELAAPREVFPRLIAGEAGFPCAREIIVSTPP